MPGPVATWRLLTPANSPAAVAIIELVGDVDAAMRRLGVTPLEPGASGTRDILGLDRGFAIRWARDTLWLMPHGGPALVRQIQEALARAGLARAEADTRPEARDDLTRRMLDALARARSPLAIDLLLDQPRRWAGRSLDDTNVAPRSLDRLISPALVVAVGTPNIGKSTLANALAGRAVSLVADAPGTTRDAVGVTIDFAGVEARYLDTPGLEPHGAPNSDAQRIALELSVNADLVLRCGDSSTPAPTPGLAPEHIPSLTIALRSDRGTPSWTHDLAVSARDGVGMAELAARIRESLVPARDLADPRPWRFWAGSEGASRG